MSEPFVTAATFSNPDEAEVERRRPASLDIAARGWRGWRWWCLGADRSGHVGLDLGRSERTVVDPDLVAALIGHDDAAIREPAHVGDA